MNHKEKNAGCLFLAVMLLCAFPAMAAEYYWVPGAADWSSSASYANADGSAAGRVPSANDELAIPENCTVTLDCDNAEHFAIANRLARVRPLTESSYFVVTVSDGKEATFSPKINYDGTTAYAGWYKGGLVKRGRGSEFCDIIEALCISVKHQTKGEGGGNECRNKTESLP